MKMKLPELQVQVKVKHQAPEQYFIKRSEDAVAVAMRIMNQDTIAWTEEMVLLCLSRNNQLIGYYRVSSGGMAGVIVDPKVIFTIALKSCAHNIILVHNHPSGNTTPSDMDDKVTDKIKHAGSLLDIKLLDHLIVTPAGTHYSYADMGKI